MNCCRMRSHQSLQAFLALAVLLIGSLAGQSLQPVLADVGDANHIGVGGVHWITRNLADGISIPVCSEVFPKATREAVKRWNEALRVTVLEAYDDHDDCKITKRPTPRNGVLSTIVSKGELINGGADYTGSVLPASCPNDNTSHACAGTELVRGMTSEQNIWRSFYGRGEVIINPTVYCRDVGTAKSKECGVDQSDYNLFEVVAHELGHILALPDYFCGRVGHEDYLEPGTRSLMNSWTAVYACNAIGGKPTELDKEDYRSMYRPGTVVETKGSTDGQVVTLRWNQFNVFAESDFEIQRKNGAIWEMEEIAEANAESITLTNQPSGEQLYRIRARTLALCPAGEDCRQVRKHFYGDPSAEITVSVPLPAPSVSAIGSSDITTNSVMLRWSEVPGAGGYEVKRTEGSGETDIESLAAAARSHPFSGLTPSTPYTFYVRATHGSNSALTSAWADAGATTKPPLLQIEVSGEPKECDRGESVGLNWEVKGGQSPYSVLFGGTRITYLSTVTSGSRSVNCQLGSVTVKVTDTDGGSASKSVSWTVNEPYIPPTQTFTLTAEISSNTCFITETVRIDWSTRNGSGDVSVTINNFPVTTSPVSVRCQSTTGSQKIVVRARDGANSSASHTFHVRVKEATNLVECLLHTGYGGNALRYRGSVCLGATASALWSGLASANIAVGCITKWDTQRREWLAYQSGRTDFNVVVSELLILSRSGCSSADEASGAAGAADSPCVDAVKPTEGTTAVSVGSATCLIVRGGGAAQITDGTHTLNLTLPTGRDWALFASSKFNDSSAGAFWFLDLTTGGWLALNPATAAELARHTPADAEGLSALLDAIVASASAAGAE